jgi:hypothetical protein
VDTRVFGGDVCLAAGGETKHTLTGAATTCATSTGTARSTRGDSISVRRTTAAPAGALRQQHAPSTRLSGGGAVSSAMGQQQLFSTDAHARPVGTPPSDRQATSTMPSGARMFLYLTSAIAACNPAWRGSSSRPRSYMLLAFGASPSRAWIRPSWR